MRHKDVYQHSLTVLDQSIELEERYGLGPDLVLRLAALLHDIGKPRTRSKLPDGRVAFHHHEVVGAAMARQRLKALRFPSAVTAEVSTLIALHLRFHGYGPGEWTDSAVRRYVRDAGPLLSRLQVLTRADCTTRNKAKAARLARAQDGLEQRIAVLSAAEELKKIRPDLDGNQIMEILGLPPGREVGRAYDYLMELRMEHGPLGPERATEELLRWAGRDPGTGETSGAGPGDPAGAGPPQPGAQRSRSARGRRLRSARQCRRGRPGSGPGFRCGAAGDSGAGDPAPSRRARSPGSDPRLNRPGRPRPERPPDAEGAASGPVTGGGHREARRNQRPPSPASARSPA